MSCKSEGLLHLNIRSVAAVLLENISENRLHVDIENNIFRFFKMVLLEALCLRSELSSACEELYEGPGGNLVDGLPPAPVRVQGGASWSTRPEKKM